MEQSPDNIYYVEVDLDVDIRKIGGGLGGMCDNNVKTVDLRQSIDSDKELLLKELPKKAEERVEEDATQPTRDKE